MRNLLCYGRPIARNGACIYHEGDGFRVANVLANLIPDPGMPRNIDHRQRFLHLREGDDRRVGLQRCVGGERLIIH